MLRHRHIAIIARLTLISTMVALLPMRAAAQSSRDRVLEYCVATQGQSRYDEGILKRGEPLPVLIPPYDVEEACRRGGIGLRVCVEDEQADYDRARRVWPQLSEAAKQACIGSFRTAGPRRYGDFAGSVLARALQEQQGRGQLRPPPNFRY